MFIKLFFKKNAQEIKRQNLFEKFREGFVEECSMINKVCQVEKSRNTHPSGQTVGCT